METTETVIVPNVINISEAGFTRSYNHDQVIGLIEDRRKFNQYKDRLKSVLRENYDAAPDEVVAIAEEMDIDLSHKKRVMLTVTVEMWITTNNPDLDESDIDDDLNVGVDLSTWSDKFDIDDYNTEVEVDSVSDDD
jgi:hypothetical protein